MVNKSLVYSNISQDVPVPVPPFWGTQAVRLRAQEVLRCLDRSVLYRAPGHGKTVPSPREGLNASFDLRVRALVREAEHGGWLRPKALYGYFPAQSDGHNLIVYEPADRRRALTCFAFPRQPEHEGLCLADYFRAVDSQEYDVVVLQLVTLGAQFDQLAEKAQSHTDNGGLFSICDLSMALVEALSEYISRVVRRSLRLTGERGKRYTWDDPVCPDREELASLFNVLPAEQIGIRLAEAFRLVPEQSRAAIVVHHPQAKCFSIGLHSLAAGQEAIEVAA